MANAYPKLLAAIAAAALLSVSPLAAQTSGSGTGTAAGASDSAGGGGADVVPFQDFDERVTPEHRTAMSTAFHGIDLPPAVTNVTIDPTPGFEIPATIETHPVPPEIVEIVPDVRGYEYVTLPDGRIALVHPQDRVIVTVLD